MCLLTCASFHFSTLEEYYTGGLFLGPLNGISDGSAGVIGLFCVMGVFGNEFWIVDIVEGIQLNAVVMAIVGIGQVDIIGAW